MRASDPPLAEIIAADVEARRGAIGLSELHELQQRAELEAPERPLLRWVAGRGGVAYACVVSRPG